MNSHRVLRVIRRVLLYIGLAAYTVFLGFPILLTLTTSLKSPRDIASTNALQLPTELHWQNFAEAADQARIFSAGLNSLIVAVGATLLVTVVALPAAYFLARSVSRFRGIATGWILASQLFPFILVIVPLFLIVKQLGLIDSLIGLILVYAVWALPFVLWMLRGHIAAIPLDIEEAAAMDGASRLRTLASIVFPLLAPGLVATSIFSFITSWNEFLIALVLIQDPALETLPVALARFVGMEGQVNIGRLAAAATLSVIPSLVFFAAIQRRLASGLLSGAIKG
jgi:multiple sugar transport system permease protein